jgi:CTP-dependent riboflavin kinase
VVVLTGPVARGIGESSRDPRGLLALIGERSGLGQLQPGTLNVQLQHPYHLRSDFVLHADEIRARAPELPEDWDREYAFDFCRIGGQECLIVRPSSSDHRDDVVEIMARVWLCDVLHLSVGSPVTIDLGGD